MLFVVRLSGEPESRWRALNARNSAEARSQAFGLAKEYGVEYGAVDPETGQIAVLGTVAASGRPTGT